MRRKPLYRFYYVCLVTYIKLLYTKKYKNNLLPREKIKLDIFLYEITLYEEKMRRKPLYRFYYVCLVTYIKLLLITMR